MNPHRKFYYSNLPPVRPHYVSELYTTLQTFRSSFSEFKRKLWHFVVATAVRKKNNKKNECVNAAVVSFNVFNNKMTTNYRLLF